MQIKEITYARVFNLGNYENERIEYTACLSDGDDPSEVLSNLKELVCGRVCVDTAPSADQSLDGFFIKNYSGQIMEVLEHPHEWLKLFDAALARTGDVKSFVTNNEPVFLRVKELANENPNPRVKQRVETIEKKAMEMMK